MICLKQLVLAHRSVLPRRFRGTLRRRNVECGLGTDLYHGRSPDQEPDFLAQPSQCRSLQLRYQRPLRSKYCATNRGCFPERPGEERYICPLVADSCISGLSHSQSAIRLPRRYSVLVRMFPDC